MKQADGELEVETGTRCLRFCETKMERTQTVGRKWTHREDDGRGRRWKEVKIWIEWRESE